jgi:hypothetical protein
MARDDAAEVDRALALLVGSINNLTDRQDSGPGVVLTVAGLVVTGTIIPDWQWFDEVEHATRAGFTVHPGGSIDDEHGGWAGLFQSVSKAVEKDRDEHRSAQSTAERLPDRYRRVLAQVGPTTSYIHLRDARVLTLGPSPLPSTGMHWRARLSEIAGWAFGVLGSEQSSDQTKDN